MTMPSYDEANAAFFAASEARALMAVVEEEAVLMVMATGLREDCPGFRYIVLDHSDQGDWMTTCGILKDLPELGEVSDTYDLEEVNPDAEDRWGYLAMNLYSSGDWTVYCVGEAEGVTPRRHEGEFVLDTHKILDIKKGVLG